MHIIQDIKIGHSCTILHVARFMGMVVALHRLPWMQNYKLFWQASLIQFNNIASKYHMPGITISMPSHWIETIYRYVSGLGRLLHLTADWSAWLSFTNVTWCGVSAEGWKCGNFKAIFTVCNLPWLVELFEVNTWKHFKLWSIVYSVITGANLLTSTGSSPVS